MASRARVRSRFQALLGLVVSVAVAQTCPSGYYECANVAGCCKDGYSCPKAGAAPVW